MRREFFESGMGVGGGELFRAEARRVEIDKSKEREQEFQKKGMELLEMLGAVEDENGNTLVDLEKIKFLKDDAIKYTKKGYKYFERQGETYNEEITNKVRELYTEYNDLYKGDITAFLLSVFKNKKVNSRQEIQAWYEAGHNGSPPEPKPLFYLPENEANAFDVAKIKAAQFHLGLWEVGTSRNLTSWLDEDFSSLYNSVPFKESEVACAIYHPNYGNGERDGYGKLIVNYKKERHRGGRKMVEKMRRGITQDWIESDGYVRGGQNTEFMGEGLRSMRDVLSREKFSHLTRAGLLRPDDFAAMSGETTEKFGEMKNVGKSGYVTIEGARYHLGRKYGREPHKVYRISENQAAICKIENGQEKIVATFTLISADALSRARETGDDSVAVWRTVGNSGYFEIRQQAFTISPYNEVENPIFSAPSSVEDKQKNLSSKEFHELEEAKRDFVRRTEFSLEFISPHERTAFLRYYQASDEEKKEKLSEFIKEYKQDGIRLFLVVEADATVGDIILDLNEILGKEEMMNIISAASDSIKLVEQQINKITAELGIDENNVNAKGVIFDGCSQRIRDAIFSIYQTVQNAEEDGNRSTMLQRAVKSLRNESSTDQVLVGLFSRIAEVFKKKTGENIDLNAYIQLQNVVVAAAEKTGGNGAYLRTLAARGELKPVPEIHWRVDRTLADYERRFGFDIREFLEMTASPNRKRTLLEFGPGSGTSKSERVGAVLEKRYNDIAMADALYYPLNELIDRVIDWKKLEKNTGKKLSANERQVMADAIYKSIMIADGETESDSFAYAEDRVAAITEDPNNLWDILAKIAPTFGQLRQVPDTISSRDMDGNVVYPYKINLEASDRSPAFMAAKLELGKNIQKYFQEKMRKGDLFDQIPAYPSGFINGDFSDIRHLANNQIDVAIGVRSTVYKRQDSYVDFMFAMADKLTNKGVFIDDNVRDNDGFYYRLGELVSIQETLRQQHNNKEIDYSVNIQLILGPGFPGEDHRQDEVPLAVVMAKNTNFNEEISSLMQNKQYRLVSLDDYIADRQNLRTLDKTGQSLKTVEEVLDDLGISPPGERRAA